MLQNVGSRFDFHMNKTLCDLRSVFPAQYLPHLTSIPERPKFSISSLIFPTPTARCRISRSFLVVFVWVCV